jgi:hypothetical protein
MLLPAWNHDHTILNSLLGKQFAVWLHRHVHLFEVDNACMKN